MRSLLVNPGSSRLKVALVECGEAVWSDAVEISAGGELGDLPSELDDLAGVDGIGVRFVHGGPDHTTPELLDHDVLDELDRISDLAPLHNPRASSVARLLLDEHPELPVVACFDTTFHLTLSRAASTYALPRAWNERWRLRRYGAHGLSHRYAARCAAAVVGRSPGDLRVVSCHLGGGASLCAVRGGTSVDTTVGLTPLDGLVMQRRPGSLDPGMLVWLLRHGLDVGALGAGIEHDSGLKGLSGTSGDIRDVLAGVRAGDADCRLALDVYVHQLRQGVAEMAASAQGIDVLAFTGGVGEHASEVRRLVCEGLGFLGVQLDEDANEGAGTDVDIATSCSPVRVVVVAAREELEMARMVADVLDARHG